MRKRSFLDLTHPTFRPLWVRIFMTALIGGWALMELLNGQTFWAILFGAAAAWMAYSFFIAFKPEDYE